MEKGATHYTHWFQPLTGSTAEKHDSFFTPDRRRQARSPSSPARSSSRASRTPRRSRSGGIRATFEARGYTAWDPTLAGVHPREPERRVPLHPDGVRLVDGRGARQEDPAAALDGRAVDGRAARAEAVRRQDADRGVHDGRPRAGVLPDRRGSTTIERPDLITTGRTLFGAKPPKGQELDDHYFGVDPGARARLHARGRAGAAASSGVPVKTRHNEVAPAQYEIAPIFENSNLGVRPPAADDGDAAERRAAVRPGLPAAREAVRGRQRLRQAQQLVDRHRHRAQPARAGRHAAREPAVPVLLHRRDRGRRQAPGAAARVGRQRRPATTAWAPTRRRRRSSRSSWARARRTCSSRLEKGEAAEASKAADLLGLGTPVLPDAADARAATATAPRRSRSPATSSSSARSGSSMSLGLPNTVLNTIVAESIDELVDEVEAAQAKGKTRDEAVRTSSRASGDATSRSSSTATTTRTSGTRRPSSAACSTCAPRRTRCRGSSRSRRSRCSSSTAC